MAPAFLTQVAKRSEQSGAGVQLKIFAISPSVPETSAAQLWPQHRGGFQRRETLKRSNETHASTTDPETRLYRKGAGMEAELAFLGEALMENRAGLMINACLTPADGHGEQNAALAMIVRSPIVRPAPHCDARVFINELRAMNVAPHVTL